MEFGCCLLMKRTDGEAEPGQLLLGQLEEGCRAVSAAGFDYVELPAWSIAKLNDEESEQAKRLLQSFGLTAPVFNSIIPPGMMLVGPEAAGDALEGHLADTFAAIRRFGGEIVVFGGGAQRNMPKGFPREEAARQLEAFLQQCERIAAEHDLVVAIEPINRKETNLIRTVEDAMELAARLYTPHVKALADTYHMHVEREETDILDEAVEMGLLAHVHLSDRDRRFPFMEQERTDAETQSGVDFETLLGQLRSAGYEGRLSLECMYANAEELLLKGKASLEKLRER